MSSAERGCDESRTGRRSTSLAGDGEEVQWAVRNGTRLVLSRAELEARWATLSKACLLDGCWEVNVERCLDGVLQPGQRALDVGANLGYCAAVMARRVGRGGWVGAVEPVLSTFRRLDSMRRLNHFSQLRTFCCALGSVEGELDLYCHDAATANASCHRDPISRLATPVRVHVRRLDGMIERGEIPPPDVVKLDVEGHELAVLEGGLELLRRERPTLIVELNERASRMAGWSARDLHAFLVSVGGYQLYWIARSGPVPVRLEHLAPPRNGCLDLLAWSPSRPRPAYLDV